MKIFFILALFAASSFAQTPSIMKGSLGTYTMAKTNIVKSAEKMPEENFAFKPTPDVRSFGDVVGHIADAQYLFCSAVLGGEAPKSSVEKTWKTKAALIEDLKAAFAYCDKAYAGADEMASKAIKFFGRDSTVINTLDFNTAHNFEHYGNLVTYMRLKGIVPPSSEPRK
jgi:uncharacterized damage-inducible protein DinB